MFSGCTGLTTVTLTDKVLAESCYANMFENCTKLKDVNLKSIEHLNNSCCFQMFKGCYELCNI
jgi:hypothetical protein